MITRLTSGGDLLLGKGYLVKHGFDGSSITLHESCSGQKRNDSRQGFRPQVFNLSAVGKRGD